MTRFTSPRPVATVAAALLLCSVFLFASKSFSQPPPPPPPCDPSLTCHNCLVVGTDPNSHLCDCPEGCKTWDIRNCCPSCVYKITMRTKNGKPFTTCCVVVDHPSYHQWTVTQDPLLPDRATYEANDHSADCLSTGEFLQITTCGLSACDHLYLDWWPAESPCTGGTQDNLIYVPPCP